MIEIKDYPFDFSAFSSGYPENSIERKILDKMYNSTAIYKYDSLDKLKFELQLRREIVNSAIALNKSGMDFTKFDGSRCNSRYWDRASSGGFKLKEGVNPSDAINDIFINGNKYATECATAMTIIYFKAVLNVFGEELFNKTFKNIYLMDWDVREPLLREVRTMQQVSDILLGDRQYFANPDVNPDTMEWQGENVIVLDNLKYYGHGIGITTGDKIIRALNANRKEGATESAYLMGTAGRPDFNKLANVYYNEEIQTSALVWHQFPMPSFSVA